MFYIVLTLFSSFSEKQAKVLDLLNFSKIDLGVEGSKKKLAKRQRDAPAGSAAAPGAAVGEGPAGGADLKKAKLPPPATTEKRSTRGANQKGPAEAGEPPVVDLSDSLVKSKAGGNKGKAEDVSSKKVGVKKEPSTGKGKEPAGASLT